MSETETNTQPPAHNADELLPPVQPPAARFIMQLFLIPLLIVSMIVGVWLLVSWIANRGSQPAELVDDIGRLNHASWQKALTLANSLSDPRSAELRDDSQLAGQVVQVLAEQIRSERTDRDHLWLQIYLCRVLGEFNLDTGLPVLLEVAAQDGVPEKTEVRRSALQAISLLIERIGTEPALENQQLVPTLVAVAQTADGPAAEPESGPLAPTHRLRSAAAYALGLLDVPASRDQLAALLTDAADDVRCNAAVGLARQTDARALPQLKKMLDPSDAALRQAMEQTPLAETERTKWLAWKRELLVSSALAALGDMNQQAALPADPDLQQLLTKVASDARFRQENRDRSAALAQSLQPAGQQPVTSAAD